MVTNSYFWCHIGEGRLLKVYYDRLNADIIDGIEDLDGHAVHLKDLGNGILLKIIAIRDELAQVS